MFKIITTLMLICALTFSACDDKEKSSEDCQEEAPVAAVEVEDIDAGLPEECEGEECPPVEEECIEDCEPVEEEPVEEEECPDEGCEEDPAPEPEPEEDPVEPEPEAGEEAPEVDPPVPG